ncbi:MAG TPA: hypothetical protein VL284_00165, partial [Thermoanaerobaculia bacterium]|nr:hypothetical protein [Thermoanaerobaculia bacterium]
MSHADSTNQRLNTSLSTRANASAGLSPTRSRRRCRIAAKICRRRKRSARSWGILARLDFTSRFQPNFGISTKLVISYYGVDAFLCITAGGVIGGITVVRL